MNATVTTTTNSTRALDVLAQQELLRANTDKIISVLSLQPDTSSVHKVEKYLDGLRIPVALLSYKPYGANKRTSTVYVYALPWARGWSVFTSAQESVGAYSWRDVPRKYHHLQCAIYNPRGAIGPHRTSAMSVANAIIYLVNRRDRAQQGRPRATKNIQASKSWALTH